jgi:hypothetical protein
MRIAFFSSRWFGRIVLQFSTMMPLYRRWLLTRVLCIVLQLPCRHCDGSVDFASRKCLQTTATATTTAGLGLLWLSEAAVAVDNNNSNSDNNSKTESDNIAFRTKAVGQEEYTNTITASQDTNISPKEAYEMYRYTHSCEKYRVLPQHDTTLWISVPERDCQCSCSTIDCSAGEAWNDYV